MIGQSAFGQLPIFKEIQGILAGMGSFSDLPLSPSPESGLTREQARLRQWDLVSEIDEAIDLLKEESNKGLQGTR